MRKCVLNCSMGHKEIASFPVFFLLVFQMKNYLLSVDFVVRITTIQLEFFYTNKNKKKNTEKTKDVRVRVQNRMIQLMWKECTFVT